MSHRSKEVDRWISDNVKIVGSLNWFLSTTISIVVVLYHLGVVRLMIAVKPYRSNPREDFVSISLPSPEDKKWRSHFLRLALIFFLDPLSPYPSSSSFKAPFRLMKKKVDESFGPGHKTMRIYFCESWLILILFLWNDQMVRELWTGLFFSSCVRFH